MAKVFRIVVPASLTNLGQYVKKEKVGKFHEHLSLTEKREWGIDLRGIIP
jgi:hypothetical protein